MYYNILLYLYSTYLYISYLHNIGMYVLLLSQILILLTNKTNDFKWLIV